MSSKHKLLVLVFVGVVGIAAAACWAAGGVKLLLNGKVVSSDVLIINGTPYVPLKEMARSLNIIVVKRPEGYVLTRKPVVRKAQRSQEAMIGDELFTGKWRFQVLKTWQAAKYQERYYTRKRTILPRGKGDILAIVDCRVKNGLSKTQSPFLTERMPGRTALIDAKGKSYPPLDYDARQMKDKTESYQSAPVAPGGKADFSLIFSIPRGTTPTAVVFTTRSYPESISTAKDVRVALRER